MKRFSLFLTLLLTGTILFLVSDCEKEDFRDKYIGDWTFIIYRSATDSKGVTTSDTIYCDGNVRYDLGYNELRITYCAGTFYIVSVEADGKILNRCTGYPHYCGGEFYSTESLYYYHLSGSVSSKSSVTLRGSRIR
jgi:hypothetical protein